MKTNYGILVVLILFAASPFVLAWTTPVPITEVNTQYNDKASYLSYDGKTLYFSRSGTDSFYYTRLYQATRDATSGPFTQVSEISTLNSSGFHVTNAWVSPDNLRMYYYATDSGYNVKLSERSSVNDDWLPGTNIDELNELGNIASWSLTSDELNIFFASDNVSGGNGGYDIWMASRSDLSSPFDNVTNISAINATTDELDPFVSPDGLSLYYTITSAGIAELFKATRASTGDSFGNVEHLSFFDVPGGQIRYPSLSSDGTALYFTQFLPGSNQGDIYVSYIPEPATLLLLAFGSFVTIRMKQHKK